jgi:primase-polymerase (primpol)-like protein
LDDNKEDLELNNSNQIPENLENKEIEKEDKNEITPNKRRKDNAPQEWKCTICNKSGLSKNIKRSLRKHVCKIENESNESSSSLFIENQNFKQSKL